MSQDCCGPCGEVCPRKIASDADEGQKEKLSFPLSTFRKIQGWPTRRQKEGSEREWKALAEQKGEDPGGIDEESKSVEG